MPSMSFDLNLAPEIVEKASEWVERRKYGHSLLQLKEHIRCLEDELAKIQPFGSDLFLVVGIVKHVITKLKEDLRRFEDVEMEGDRIINPNDNLSTTSTTTTTTTAAAIPLTCVVMADDGGERTSYWRSQYPSRKTRRRWCRELHRRFVDALNELGGPRVATPKNIKKLMNVRGLTNDEVKSHLQKHRLHFKKIFGHGLMDNWTSSSKF